MSPRVAASASAILYALCASGGPDRRLFDAIAEVESSRGRASANVYQLRRVYVADCNRIARMRGDTRRWTYADRLDRAKAESMMRLYWSFYAPGGSDERLARIHNGGPDGCGKPATEHYWRRVQRVLRRNGGER